MTPPLRLRILIRRFHPVVGGMERQALQLAIRLADRGVAPSVWTRRILPDSPLFDRVEGIPVRRFGPAGSGRLGEYGSLPRLAWALRREAAISADDPDVLAVFGTGDLALVAAGAAQQRGTPWLMRPATEGDLSRYLDPALAPGGDPLRRWLRGHLPPSIWRGRRLRSASTSVAISPGIAAELAAWGFAAPRIRELPNGVDLERFRPADAARKADLRQRLGLPADAPIVLFLGRLVRRKGLLELAEAWRRLGAAGTLPDRSVMVLAGSGEGQADRVDGDLDKILADDRSVRRPGAVAAPEDWLAAADVFVLPSHAEGLPNAFLEAMAAGLPILASDIAVHRQLSGEGRAALLHPVRDTTALADCLARLLGDRDLRDRLGREARTLAVTHYGLNAVADRWADLLLRLAWERGDADGSAYRRAAESRPGS
ncbi:MAG TPA: glycosyltransferase family 4 protein [Anaerolineae bacterium]|nr:glycosyltransferase family 4 protein [Anaerolineae bacterium]